MAAAPLRLPKAACPAGLERRTARLSPAIAVSCSEELASVGSTDAIDFFCRRSNRFLVALNAIIAT